MKKIICNIYTYKIMSIATLKKKTHSKYNASLSKDQSTFSLVGTRRNQGYIGQDNLGRSNVYSIMKDDVTHGHGGNNGEYVHKNIKACQTSLNDPNVIKTSSQYFGSQCIVVAVDVKKNNNQWTVYSHGGTKNTGIDAIHWLRKVEELGAGEVLLTSMDKDGTKSGFDLEILSQASEILNIPIIASGGVGKIEHFYEGVTKGNANALLAASVFHFNEFSIMDVKKYLKQKNLEVRI